MVKKTVDDDEYKKATKPLIDDAMRTDALGPNFRKVLRDYKPANDEVQRVLAEGIKSNPEVKNALSAFIKEHDAKRKGLWVGRIVWLILGAGAVGVVTLVVNYLTANPK